MEPKNEISVLGKKIQTKIVEIGIFQLHYWKENPRINAIINQKYRDQEIQESEIETELWEKDSVKDLFNDIDMHGGLIDEILVKDNIVLEGNSRLCAYRHLYSRAKEKNNLEDQKKWSTIRARVIPVDTSDQIVFSILGTWHIKGKNQWDTFEKSAYLKRMRDKFNYSEKQIADLIGQTEKFVKENIEAHDIMVDNQIFDLDKYSYFYEYVKGKNNSKNASMYSQFPDLTKRVIETINSENIRRAEEIRNLPKILNDQKIRKEYLNYGIDFLEAVEDLKQRHPDQEDSFYNQIKRTTRILQKCSVQRIDEIKKDPNKKYLIKCLYKEINSIYSSRRFM